MSFQTIKRKSLRSILILRLFILIKSYLLYYLQEEQEGGVKMPFLAKGIMIFTRNNRWKTKLFSDKEKALRFWKKCKRRGLDAQLVY